MNDDERDDRRIRRILVSSTPPLTPPAFDALGARRPRAPIRDSLAFTLVAVLVAVVALIAGGRLSEFRQQQAASPAGSGQIATMSPGASATGHVALPQPVPQPTTRTSAAAQVAWVGTYSAREGVVGYVGVDATGTIVGRLSTADGPYWRSPDGRLIVGTADRIVAYSARDGSIVRSYGAVAGGRVIDASFSPDGRWLAIIGSAADVQLVDLETGASQTTPLAHAADAHHPGLSGSDPSALVWSTVLFSPDSRRVYTLLDWGGPLRISAFDVTRTGLTPRGTAVDGTDGKRFTSCGGPGLTGRIVGNGATLVTFCYVDAGIAFIDLATLTERAAFHAAMANPFWLAPIFTPDGHLLYLHQYASFGDAMQVVDLASHTLLGPVKTPRRVTDPGPFAWLFPIAYAGGTPSTIPVSPDGTKLYAVADHGVTVLRVPDLRPLARLAPDIVLREVWVSGDGRMLYGTTNGRTFYLIPERGGAPITIELPADNAGSFIASEHG